MERSLFWRSWKEWLPDLLMILYYFCIAACVVILTITMYTREYNHAVIVNIFVVLPLILSYASRKLKEKWNPGIESPFEKKYKEWLPGLLIFFHWFFIFACVVVTILAVINWQMRYTILFFFFSCLATIAKYFFKKNHGSKEITML